MNPMSATSREETDNNGNFTGCLYNNTRISSEKSLTHEKEISKTYPTRCGALFMFAETYYSWTERKPEACKEVSLSNELKTLKNFRTLILQFGVDDTAFIQGVDNILNTNSSPKIHSLNYLSNVVKTWNPEVSKEFADNFKSKKPLNKYFHSAIPGALSKKEDGILDTNKQHITILPPIVNVGNCYTNKREKPFTFESARTTNNEYNKNQFKLPFISNETTKVNYSTFTFPYRLGPIKENREYAETIQDCRNKGKSEPQKIEEERNILVITKDKETTRERNLSVNGCILPSVTLSRSNVCHDVDVLNLGSAAAKQLLLHHSESYEDSIDRDETYDDLCCRDEGRDGHETALDGQTLSLPTMNFDQDVIGDDNDHSRTPAFPKEKSYEETVKSGTSSTPDPVNHTVIVDTARRDSNDRKGKKEGEEKFDDFFHNTGSDTIDDADAEQNNVFVDKKVKMQGEDLTQSGEDKFPSKMVPPVERCEDTEKAANPNIDFNEHTNLVENNKEALRRRTPSADGEQILALQDNVSDENHETERIRKDHRDTIIGFADQLDTVIGLAEEGNDIQDIRNQDSHAGNMERQNPLNQNITNITGATSTEHSDDVVPADIKDNAADIIENTLESTFEKTTTTVKNTTTTDENATTTDENTTTTDKNTTTKLVKTDATQPIKNSVHSSSHRIQLQENKLEITDVSTPGKKVPGNQEKGKSHAKVKSKTLESLLAKNQKTPLTNAGVKTTKSSRLQRSKTKPKNKRTDKQNIAPFVEINNDFREHIPVYEQHETSEVITQLPDENGPFVASPLSTSEEFFSVGIHEESKALVNVTDSVKLFQNSEVEIIEEETTIHDKNDNRRDVAAKRQRAALEKRAKIEEKRKEIARQKQLALLDEHKREQEMLDELEREALGKAEEKKKHLEAEETRRLEEEEELQRREILKMLEAERLEFEKNARMERMSNLLAERKAELQLKLTKEKVARDIEEAFRRKEQEMLSLMEETDRLKYLEEKRLEEEERRRAEEENEQRLELQNILDDNERQRKVKEFELRDKRLNRKLVNRSFARGKESLQLAQEITRSHSYSYFYDLPLILHGKHTKHTSLNNRGRKIDDVLPSLAELMDKIDNTVV